jgi:hypothetical protein
MARISNLREGGRSRAHKRCQGKNDQEREETEEGSFEKRTVITI